MKISIITSCYNRVETIEGAIRSVFAQDYGNIEYIIVDGNSDDGSKQIIEKMVSEKPSRIDMKYISEPDSGMYEAINKGIRMASGDCIGLVHSDDFLYSPHVISHVVRQFELTRADFLYGDGLFVAPDDTDKVIRKWIGGDYRLWKVRHGWLPLHPTCYIRRDAMMKRGLYNESYKIAADSDLLFRYLLCGDLTVTYLPEYIVRMRMGGMSTDSVRRRQMWHEDIRMYRSHGMNPTVTKLEKMMWKVPQFIKARLPF